MTQYLKIEEPKSASKPNKLAKYWWVGVVLIFVVIGGFLFTRESGVDAKNLADDDPALGPIDAKVTVIEFSDFQCPACKSAEPLVKNILAAYGDKIRFVYRDFPLTQIHEYAFLSAMAAECADEQGRFWDYHDKLFEMQPKLDLQSLENYAKDLGLDTEQFNQCLETEKYKGEVNADLADAASLGLKATPSFVINDKIYSGIIPYNEFASIIEGYLG
jgi:protein-disulfide isomerase